MRDKIKIICALILLSISTYAQQNPFYTVDKNEFYKLYSMGRFFLDQGEFQDALHAFSKMDSMYPNNSNVLYYIGQCKYNKAYHKRDAIPYFFKVLPNVSMNFKGEFMDTTAPVFSYFLIADALLANDQVDTAIIYNRLYYTNIEQYYAPAYYSDISREALLLDADKQLATCYNARKYKNNPLKIKITDIGHNINTDNDDYYVVLSADGKTKIYTSRLLYKNKFTENIFITKEVKGEWTTPVNMYPSTEDMVGVSITPDGKQLILFKRDVNNGDIFIANIDNDKLSDIKPLPGSVNSKELETFASISPDGKTLYFSSERKGGVGGMDIWYSKKEASGVWGKPENMGISINTPDDELSPFISFDGTTLYFSSNGHETMGGFDVMKSTLTAGVWSPVINVGYPLNTPDDNFYMAFDKEGLYVYFSALNAKGNVDLYKAIILENIKQVVVKASVADEKTNLPLNSQFYVIAKESHDTIHYSSNKDGTFKVVLAPNKDYDILVKGDNHNNYSNSIHVIQDEEFQLPLIVLTEIIKSATEDTTKTIVSSVKTISKKEEVIELDKVFFDFNKSTIQPASLPQLQKLEEFLKQNMSVKILIIGNTDSIGSAAFNKPLSTNRAKAIYNILVKNGVNPNRLSCYGAGFEKPTHSNATEDGRQKNRRVEFVIRK